MEKHWSEGTAKLAVWLSGIADFEMAAEILEKVGQVDISDSSIWRRTEKWGERIREIEKSERERANALPKRWERPVGRKGEAGRMGVAMDGGMLHIRKEGWKELKVGCLFEVEVQPVLDPKTREVVDLAHAVNNSYTAHLGGPEVFGQGAWAEAQRRGWERCAETQVVGDGATWIWNLAGEHFAGSHQVVDWYHATEHLGKAAQLLKGEGTAAADRWYKMCETALYQGHAERIGEELAAAAEDDSSMAEGLKREAGYFVNNQRRMNYLELREEGWVIGSGMVESGVKQFKSRFTGSGMQWSRKGAERLIPVRSAIMSQRFGQVWDAAYALPPN
jgi:hypothetical protein